MKKTIQHIAIYLLTSTVLFASTGVSVHQFYCYCQGQVTASIFKPGDPCDVEVREKMAECCKSRLVKGVKKCDGKKDCSDCTSKYVKLDVDFLLFNSDFELPVPHSLTLVKYFAAQKTIVKNNRPLWENDLPPPPYGKSLLPHFQAFLC